MRDISSSPKPQFSRKDIPEDLPPEAKKLYEKHANTVKKSTTSGRRFTGSQVPITNVHVPRQATLEKKQTVSAMVERRPLFAVIDKPALKKKAKPHKPSKTAMLLGTKETKIALGLFGVVLACALIAGFLFLPYVTITLRIKTSPLLVDQKIPLAVNPAVVPNAVPATVIEQAIQIQGQSPVNTTQVEGTKAHGTVRVINRTFDTQKIKEKSRLITKDGTLFYLVGPAIIPPATSDGISSVSVQVEAGEAGEKGNITPQKLTFAALDANAQAIVYAESDTTFTGGAGNIVHIVQESDIAQAKESAKAQAKAQLEQLARGKLQAGWSLLHESFAIDVSQFTPNHTINDKVDSIEFTTTATARVLAYQQGALENTLKNSLISQIDQNSVLFPGAIAYTTSVDNVNWEQGTAQLTARVTHSTIPNFSLSTLKDKITGRSEQEAKSYLEGLQGVNSVSVSLWPFWVQNIPQINQRINLNIEPVR